MDPKNRFHVRTVVAYMHYTMNRVETGILSAFLLGPESFTTLLAHVGSASGPVPATHVANIPIIVWIDNCFWIVYLDHIAAVTRDIYTAFVHWMWLFVHVSQPVSNNHIRLRESLKNSHEFLSDMICAAFVQSPGIEPEEPPVADAVGVGAGAGSGAGSGAGAGTGEGDTTAEMQMRVAKRVRIDAIDDALDRMTRVCVEDRMHLAVDAVFK